MPKWKQHPIHPDLVVYLDSEDPVFLGDIDRDAETACSAHNADIDALEKELAELRAEVASAVKLAKAAIKYLPKCDYITIDGTESISTMVTLMVHALTGGNSDEEE